MTPRDRIYRKRHKATKMCRTKAPKEGQPDSGVKRSQPMRFGLWRELVPLLSLSPFISLSPCIIVFSTMIYDRNDHLHLCFLLIFFSFFLARRSTGDASRDIISNIPEFPELMAADSRVSFCASFKRNALLIECKKQ